MLGTGSPPSSAPGPPAFIPAPPPTQLEIRRTEVFAVVDFAAQHVPLLLREQLLLLVLLTPAVVAGALGHEKERNTLMALFGTHLRSREIVAGKLLGRLSVLGGALVGALPILVLFAVVADIGIGRLILALGLVAALLFAMAGVAMLSSVWTRRTGDAILACYAAIIIGFLGFGMFLSNTRLPTWLDVVNILGHLLTPHSSLGLSVLGPYFFQFGTLGAVGALCCAVATLRLRPACLEQVEKRPARWLWAFRPGVGDSPVRWRERYIMGLAPLPVLRIVPGWMAMLGVLTFSGILAVTSLDLLSGKTLFPALETGDFTAFRYSLQLRADYGRVASELAIMGGTLLVLGIIVVGVRCATSIAEEKRRKTWDDLCVTPLTIEEILRAKQWGVLQATIPYLMMYALPMFALSTLAGTWGVLTTAAWLGFTCLCLVVAASLGTQLSAGHEEPSPWLDSAPELVDVWMTPGVNSHVPYPVQPGSSPRPYQTMANSTIVLSPSSMEQEPEVALPARPPTDPDLKRLINAWPRLPLRIRRAMMVLVDRSRLPR
jgi:hypothetical protein